MNVNNSINSINKMQSYITEKSHEIAKGKEITENLMEIQKVSLYIKANLKVVERSNDMIGKLLDKKV